MASVALLSTGCDKDFEEKNTTGNQALQTDANLLLTAAMLNTTNTLYNLQIGGDMGSGWAQHWAKVQYNDEERYIPRRELMTALWDNMYFAVIKEAKDAYNFAGIAPVGEEPNTNLQGVSLVLQANAFQILTDAFGPVPMAEFGSNAPAYDSQEAVYDGIIAMLDEAEAKFADGHGEFTATADLIYGGDITKWRKFAASLKLKALMRISKVRPSVGTQIQALVDSGLLFSSNADSAQLAYSASAPDANPIYETIVNSNRLEYKMSSVLVNKLDALNDPRLAVFASPNDDGEYVGNDPGNEDPSNYGGYSSPGAMYLDPTLPAVFLSYAQVEFYLAEAINEGLIDGTIDDARMHYVNGINANFEFNQLAPSVAYTSSAAVDFTTQAEAREKIATQMWFALYGQGFEAWTEWRRTMLPALSIAIDAAIDVIPNRFYYSLDEPLVNPANYAAASATLSNGDSMESTLWWQ